MKSEGRLASLNVNRYCISSGLIALEKILIVHTVDTCFPYCHAVIA